MQLLPRYIISLTSWVIILISKSIWASLYAKLILETYMYSCILRLGIQNIFGLSLYLFAGLGMRAEQNRL